MSHRSAVVALALVAGLSTVPAAHAGACNAADVLPTVAPMKARSATLCLLKHERASRGLGRLRPSRLLAVAARRHSKDMVRKQYFAHDSLNGHTFDVRIKATGYLAASNGWEIGENLAWGSGAQSTPRSIVAAWMASPPHRRNILKADYRQIGIAIHKGSPASPDPAAATYTTEFGVRG